MILRYRRAMGVGAFVLAVAHSAHQLEHSLQWNGGAIALFQLALARWETPETGSRGAGGDEGEGQTTNDQ
ncbi:MAG: hypothetical protein SVX43_10245 [Cyanobacteriota bacterium]|nr:hypothetical protein [Cyanobacteriota bacterium]